MKQGLADRLVTLFAQHWPEEAAELANRTAIEQIIDETADRTGHGDQAAASPPDLGQIDPCRSAQEERLRADRAGRKSNCCGDATSSSTRIVTCDRQTYTLTVLAVEGFLPGYGVYEGGIVASARRGVARHLGSAGVRPVPQQRGRPAGVCPRQPALRQPGNVLRRPLPPGG